MKKLAVRQIDPWMVCAALLALVPLQALLQPGMPHTADGQVHLLRTWEVVQLLQQGIWYPRWAPDFYLGYGYPFFNFYAPGAHFVAALLALAGLGVTRGVVVLQGLALLLYPLGAYLAVRSILPGGRDASDNGPAALLAAALYLYAPLRFRELFVQGNLSQWLALALLPWCAWLLSGVAKRGSLRRAAVAGGALAVLLYAHHPSAFLAWPSLAVYAAALAVLAHDAPPEHGQSGTLAGRIRARLATSGPRLLAVGTSFLLAAALAAPFWLPSILELRDVNINAIATGSFNAALNLLPLADLLALPAVQDGAALNPPMPNSLGSIQGLLAVAGLAAAVYFVLSDRRKDGLPRDVGLAWAEPSSTAGWSRRQAGLALLVVAMLLASSLLLILPAAAPVWQAVPLARLIAFPWRLLGPALLWASMLGGAALYLIPRQARLPALVALLVLVPLSVAPYLYPRPFAAASEPDQATLARYELNGGALATASANEYLPRWVQDTRPLPQPVRQAGQGLQVDATSLPPGSMVEPGAWRRLDFHYVLTVPAAVSVRLRQFYFPGWRAWVDDQPADIRPSSLQGFIEVPVPAGRHELHVAFGSTPPRLAGGLLAVAGLVAASLLLLSPRRRKIEPVRPKPAATPIGSYRGALVACTIVLVFALLKVAIVGPYTTWFRRQSSITNPAGMQHPVHARFANGVELLGYDLTRAEVRQGDTLGVRLYWRTQQPGTPDARPFLHLDAPDGTATWANQTKLNAGDKPMTSWPPGFFVVDDYQLPVDSSAPPVVARLNAGLLAPGGKLIPLAEGGDLAGLGSVRILEQQPVELSVLPNHDRAYNVGDTIRLAGYEVRPIAASTALEVTLYWQVRAPVPADYTVFLHVRDAIGRAVTQQDGPPMQGLYPSTAWLPGQVIPDRHLISLPEDVPMDGLRVATGLYTLTDGQRAPVTDAAGTRQPADEILLDN